VTNGLVEDDTESKGSPRNEALSEGSLLALRATGHEIPMSNAQCRISRATAPPRTGFAVGQALQRLRSWEVEVRRWTFDAFSKRYFTDGPSRTLESTERSPLHYYYGEVGRDGG
jgi:hypothetical protein